MTHISKKYIPSVGPSDAKIVFIGEAGGTEEEQEGEPFVGTAGEKLMAVLGRNGLQREDVFLTNLSKYRPEHNNFRILLNSPQLEDGLKELREELLTIKPNVIVPLGNWPLYYLTGKMGKQKGKFVEGTGITNWRGSILTCTLPGLEDVKCIPTFHPSYIARSAANYPTFDNDVGRIVKDSAFPELRLPAREYIIADSYDKVEHWTGKFIKDYPELSVDIETFGSTLACCGFSPSPDLGVCFPYNNDNYVLECIRRILSSDISCIFHFGSFDANFLQRFYDIETRNWGWDTYVCQRVIDPELPKTLAYITSVNTREPFYKFEGKVDSDIKSWSVKFDKKQLYIYNCKDVCVTKECKDVQKEELNNGPPQWSNTFTFDMACATEVCLTISRRGMLVDQKRREQIKKALLEQWVKHQEQLNILVGKFYSTKPKLVDEHELPQLLNVNSNKQVAMCLYDDLGFKARRTRDGKITADEHAVIALIGLAKKELDARKTEKARMPWLRKLMVCKLILIIRGIRKKKNSYVDFSIGQGGRARSLYKQAPDTGRLSAEKWVDKTGFNMQTMPRSGVEVE